MNLSNVVAIVSGGASGLGEATALRLAAAGARGVAILDVNEDAGARVAAQIGERASFFPVDVTRPDSVANGTAAARRRFGTINVIVAAAGVATPSKLISSSGVMPLDSFDRVIRVNLYGTLHLIRAAVPLMLANEPTEDGERAVLINVASAAAFEGQVGQIAYSASKAAIVGMTTPLSRELGQYGVRVTTIAPGAFETPIYASLPDQVRAGLLRQAIFPKRMGRPEEFASLVEEIIRNPIHNGRTYRLDAGLTLAPNP